MPMNNPQKYSPRPSFWEDDAFFRKVDVVIVGSGIVGLNAALRLQELEPKLKITILERGALPSGASTRNAGFACFGSVTELMEDIQTQGEDMTWQLIEDRWKGLERTRSLFRDSIIDYTRCGNYELFKEKDRDIFDLSVSKIEAFNLQLKKITGIEEVFKIADEDQSTFNFREVNHLIKNQAEGQLHPGKLVKALYQKVLSIGIEIKTGIEVEAIKTISDHCEIKLSTGHHFTAGQVLVATNGFARQLYPKLDVEAVRNQVLLTAPIQGLAWEGCFHYEQGYFYFRNVGQRILIGGGRHLDRVVETTDEFGATDKIKSALKDLLKDTILPDQTFEIDYAWSGILGVGKEKKTIVQRVDDRIVVAVRMGGMGVAIGGLIGKRGAELLLNVSG